MIPKRFEELKLSGNLPSPSGVGLAVLQCTQREEIDVERLVHCIEADPALTGRIVKLANSALRAGLVPSTTARQAAARLGPAAARSVALSFSLLSANRSGACAGFDYDRYWSWSLACASAARVLAGENGSIDPSEAYTCALLSRIGMLALASVHPEPYARVLAEARGKPPEELLRAESREFDIQHWEVAGAMMSDWGIPGCFVGAVTCLGLGERDPLLDEPVVRTLVRLLREASAVADELVRGSSGPEGEWIELLAPREDAGRAIEDLQPIVEQSRASWRERASSLRLPVPDARTGPQAFPEPSARTTPAAMPLESDAELRALDVSVEDLKPLEPSQIHVLAIDDDPHILRLLEYHLRQAGFRVTTAEDGDLGLLLALERQPHVIVTDWVMPRRSGVDLCRSLRSIEQGRRTHIVILTARDDEAQIVDAFAAGADDYVTKPFNPRILLARVGAGMRVFELQRQVEADRAARTRQAAELGLMTRKLRAAALTDVLTELPNRRYAMLRLAQEWESAVASGRPLSIVTCDVDHFKAINDQLGHEGGDLVLRATADALRAHTRRGDVVCRLGGEEFLVISVNSDAAGAQMCAERLRLAVEENRVRVGESDVRVTSSFGWAERTASMADIDALLRAADEAVYAAKSSGRNTVRGPLRRSA